MNCPDPGLDSGSGPRNSGPKHASGTAEEVYYNGMAIVTKGFR